MHNLLLFGAQYLIALPVLVAAYVAFKLSKSKRLEMLFLLVCGGIISLLLAKVGSHAYSDPRPFVADHVTPLFGHSRDNGFPSDHTLLSAFMAFAVLVFRKKLGVALLVVALLIGTARVAAGVHHAIDIVGGFVAAGLGVLIAYGCLRLYKAKKSA